MRSAQEVPLFWRYKVKDGFKTKEQLIIEELKSRLKQLSAENDLLYRASQEQSARLEAINSIGAAAVSSPDPDTALYRTLETTCRALNASEGSILSIDPDTDELVFELSLTEETRVLRNQRLAPGQGIAGWVARQGQAMCVNVVRQDPRFYGGVDAITGFETHSLLCVPLRHRGEIIGVMEIVNKRRGEFGDEDLSLLEIASSIAVMALENARLYKAIRERPG
jgi:GAF domain-containing protein